ncbi:hypothetical protein UFOVP182_39 [uncultured Caudovirales phage]|uniref:Uncharacterized protein n=1 Tax=uncultured Caudovirales phage TaxID=2100421 RepID=A0A6J7WIA1_9CAUD|nr:hypothetical protein UFOVP182_39 [uncultured Caudovirales phage]
MKIIKKEKRNTIYTKGYLYKDEVAMTFDDKRAAEVFAYYMTKNLNAWLEEQAATNYIDCYSDELWNHYATLPDYEYFRYLDADYINGWIDENDIFGIYYETTLEKYREECQASFIKEGGEETDSETLLSETTSSEEYYEYEEQYFDCVNNCWYLRFIDEILYNTIEELDFFFEVDRASNGMTKVYYPFSIDRPGVYTNGEGATEYLLSFIPAIRTEKLEALGI